MYRWLFITVVVLWVAALTALVRRDVWPAWTAQDAPRFDSAQFSRSRPEDRQEQFGIFDSSGKRIGTAWGNVQPEASGNTALDGTILIDKMALIPAVRIETVTEFDPEGELDSFRLDLYGVPMIISVRGERRGIYFPCELQIGTVYRQANLDMSASRMIGESLRPFTVLPKLHVGQAWRMQVLDPLSAIQSPKAEFRSVIAQVTGREAISVGGRGRVECFVVEIRDQGAKAWVADDGRVLRQEVSVPGLKKLALQAEEYDANQRQDAKDRVRMMTRRERGSRDGGD